MKSKLLIVDDSATILKIVAMAFEKEDIVVQGAGNGKEALEQMSDFKPDIVVADTEMPGMSGFDLSKKIKSSDEFKSIPVLLLTSDFEGLDEKLFNESLADDHIAKPFKSDRIVSKVKRLLEQGPTEQAAEKTAPIKLSADDVVETAAPIKLSAEDAVDEPAPIKLSADDVVETAPPIKLSAEDAVADTPDSAEEESLDDIVDDIIQESVLPEEPPEESAEPEPASPVPAADKPAETGESPTPLDDMSLEEMLASAEEMLLAEEEENKSGPETASSQAGEPADDAPAAQKEEPKPAKVIEPPEEKSPAEAPAPTGTEETISAAAPPQPAPDEAEKPEPAPAAAANEAPKNEAPEEETAKEEKAEPAPAANTADDDMSIEELLNSAEELLKDNYLEKTPAAVAENATALPPSVPSAETQPETGEPAEISASGETGGQAVPAGAGEHTEEGNLADVDASALDSEDELDSVFNAIQSFEAEAGAEAEGFLPPGAVESTPDTGASHIYVEPESEDLLEKMAPAAFTSGGIEGKPDLIRETLSYLSDLSPEREKTVKSRAPQSHADQRRKASMNKETTGDMFSEVVGEHIQRILERSLKDSIAKEISGLSQTIERSVREIVKEVTPGIARTIIQEEIEKIRKMEEV